MLVGVSGVAREFEEPKERFSIAGSASSRTVGDRTCAIVFRLAESEEDMRRIIRLALFCFLSPLSELFDEIEPDLGGGEALFDRSLLEVDLRLLIDIGRWRLGDACVEGGREGDLSFGEDKLVSRVIDLRRSLNEVLVSLIKSLMIVIDDLPSFVAASVVLEELDSRLSLDWRLSSSVAFGGSSVARW